MNIFGEPISVIKYSFRSFYFIFIILLPVSLNSYFMSFKRSCSSLMVDCWKIFSFPLWGTAVPSLQSKALAVIRFPARVCDRTVVPQRGKSGAPRTTIWEKYLVFPSKTFGSGSEAS